MILHWLTVGWRSLIANPLFSLITVISLAIGCCGALLAGSNIKQHLTFERWVPAAERIVVITRTQPDPFGAFGAGGSTTRIEGGGIGRPMRAVTAPMKDAIAGKIPGLEAQGRFVSGQPLLQEDQDELDRRRAAGPPPPGELPRPFAGTIFVDADFFEIFPLFFIEGSAEGLSEPDRIVLTETRAKRLFGSQSAVGQTVEGVKGRSLTVVGVLRDLPVATHLAFESMAGLRTLEMIEAAERAAQEEAERQQGTPTPGGPVFIMQRPSMNDWAASRPGGHYLKMAAGGDFEAFQAAAIREIQAAGDQGAKQASRPPGYPPGMTYTPPKFTYSVVPLLDMHLGGPDLVGGSSTGDVTMLATLAAGALALLGVSAFNYLTLSLARSLRRRREVAVRKVLGADRSALVQQYLAESALVTAIALAIGFVAAWVLHPWFARAIGQPETLFELFDPVFLSFSLVGFLILAVAVGAYPAFYLAHVRPRTALGEGGSAAPGRIGQVVTASLLGLQIAAATGLLIVAMTMGAQANYIETRPMGFVMKDRYQVSANCPLSPELSQAQLGALFQRCQSGARDLIGKTPGVEQAFFFNGQLLSEMVQTQAYGRTSAGEEIGRAMRMSVDTDFLQGMGATLLAGRFFDSASTYDRQLIERSRMMSAGPPQPGSTPPPKIEVVPVIVTRAALSMFGSVAPEEAIGQRFAPQPMSQYPFEVVGVVEDWQTRPLKHSVMPIIFVPSSATSAVVEIAPGRVQEVRESLTSGWREVTGDDKAAVQLQSMADLQERTYQTDYRLMRAVSSFALVAIIVAGLGVYGLSAFEMRRRVREIGIRKALGASPLMVAGRVIGRQVAFAAGISLLAWPLGFWIANQWLLGFVYRTQLGWIVPLVATLIVMAFVALAVGLSSARAAGMRPGLALR